MIIKILLVTSLFTAVVLLLRGRRSPLGLLLRRSAAVLTIIVGMLAVLFPDAVTVVANAIGVGRGTDLVLYGLCVAFLFVSIALTQRLTGMHDTTVELVRKVALLEAELRDRETVV